MERVILLDVSAIMYRAFFANLNFKTKNEPTGAVYGFTNTLLSIIDEFSPKYIGAAFDVKRSSLKRSEIYPEYKAKRESAPEDLVTQIPRIEELLDAFNINRFKEDGYEADDVLGTLAKKLADDNTEVIIITGDKDLAQLIDKNIKIALLGKSNGGDKFQILANDEDVVNFIGVPSNKIIDLFGLIGDSSDGIPGVRKIGPKKAIPMIEKYGNLENIYENLDSLTEIPGVGASIINNMKEDKELSFLSRELATIFTDIPINFKKEDLLFSKDEESLSKLFKKLEFKYFIKKLSLESVDTPELETSDEEDKNSVFPSKSNLTLDDNRPFLVINNIDDLNSVNKDLSENDLTSVYFEKVGIAISTSKNDFYVPLFHGGLLNSNFNINDLKEWFLNSKQKFISYNFKNILNLDIEIPNMDIDLMIGYHLVSSETKEDPRIAIQYLTDISISDYKEVFGKDNLELLSTDKYGVFLTMITRGLLASNEPLVLELKEKDLLSVIYDVEMPLIKILSKMERKGIKINRSHFQNFSVELAEELYNLETEIYKEAGEKFNLNSPKQLSEILFVKLGLPTAKKTKTGFSTDVDVLEGLQYQGFQIAESILKYRKLFKLKTTYVDTLPLLADNSERIHTTFNQIGTVTGRLSSSEPNLQNIPVKTDEGMKIRQGFIAEKGNLLLGIDYSQVELRVLTEISKDENLIAAYSRNEDLHEFTAKKIFSLSPEKEVSRQERIMAKIINFSIIYGKTPFGLSKELNISVGDASDYIKRYFEQYPKVKELEERIIKETEEKGYVTTLFGRRRIINGINSKNKIIKNQAERMAVNTVIQGTAAELLKKVMIKIYDFIKDKEDISLLLQVHDELIFEVKEEVVEKYKEEITNIMQNTVKFDDVNLIVSANIGKNWAEIK